MFTTRKGQDWLKLFLFFSRGISMLVQSLSRVQLFATPWTAARQASLSITNCQSLLKLMSIESVMPSSHLILCLPLLLLPPIFPSLRVFCDESAFRISWPKLLELQQQSSQWIFRVDFFTIDWFDFHAFYGILKSLFQHHNLKASVLWCSAFFMVQLLVHTWVLEKPYLWLYGPLSAKSCFSFLICCLGLS